MASPWTRTLTADLTARLTALDSQKILEKFFPVQPLGRGLCRRWRITMHD
jgi:hypothetical protein